MGKIIIMTDSASDISEKEEKELGIKILPFPVVIGGKSYLSRVDFDNEGFYKLMAENDDLPKTSQITAYQFGEVYKELVEQGYGYYICKHQQGWFCLICKCADGRRSVRGGIS